MTNREFCKYLAMIVVFGLTAIFYFRDSRELMAKIGLGIIVSVGTLVFCKYQDKQMQLQNEREQKAYAKAYPYQS